MGENNNKTNVEKSDESNINAKLNTHPFPRNNVDFLSLNRKLQSKIINNAYKDKRGGFIGKFLGNNAINIAMNIAFTICILLIGIAIGDFVRIWIKDEPFDYEFFDLIIPVITLTLGYIFGKASHSK